MNCRDIILPLLTADRPMILVAAAVLIDADKRVLLTERPLGKSMAGLWEFPGGKIESGELPEYALVRELREELDLDVGPGCLQPLTFASYAYEKFHLLMPLYSCHTWRGVPKAREGQKLAWVSKHQWHQYKMPPADDKILPILFELI